jgi:hypothetical protein
MKKFIACFALFLLAFASMAQTRLTLKFLDGGQDTITVFATATKTTDLALGSYYDAVKVTATITRTGGTTLAGTIKLQERLNADAGYTDITDTSTTVTNATTQSITWKLPAGIYGDLRAHYVGSGAGTGTAKVWAGTTKIPR